MCRQDISNHGIGRAEWKDQLWVHVFHKGGFQLSMSSQCWEMIEMGQIKFCGSQNNFMMTRVKIRLLTGQPHHPKWNLWKIQLSEIHWKYMWKGLIIISILIIMKNIHFQWASYFWSWLVRPAVQRSSIQSDIYQVQFNSVDFKALSNGIIETGVTVYAYAAIGQMSDIQRCGILLGLCWAPAHMIAMKITRADSFLTLQQD